MKKAVIAAVAAVALSAAAAPSNGVMISGGVTQHEPPAKIKREQCHRWPGATTLVPRRMIGARVDTVVGHDTFRVGPCDGWTNEKGSSFVIHVGHGGKKDGWVSIT